MRSTFNPKTRGISNIKATAPSFALVFWLVFANFVSANDNSLEKSLGQPMNKIVITVESERVEATLADNPTAQAFLELLPLTLELTDYHNTEKVSDLPKRLPYNDKDGYAARKGDITYYGPWGNLAIFYNDFSYAKGLIPLGEIYQGLSHLIRDKPFKVTIEQIAP